MCTRTFGPARILSLFYLRLKNLAIPGAALGASLFASVDELELLHTLLLEDGVAFAFAFTAATVVETDDGASGVSHISQRARVASSHRKVQAGQERDGRADDGLGSPPCIGGLAEADGACEPGDSSFGELTLVAASVRVVFPGRFPKRDATDGCCCEGSLTGLTQSAS